MSSKAPSLQCAHKENRTGQYMYTIITVYTLHCGMGNDAGPNVNVHVILYVCAVISPVPRPKTVHPVHCNTYKHTCTFYRWIVMCIYTIQVMAH